jgi:hypothetical protein
MTDDRVSEFEDRLRRRIEEHREERAETGQELSGESTVHAQHSPDFSGMSMREAAEVYDRWVSAQIAAHRGERVAPGPPPVDEVPVESDLSDPAEVSRITSLDQLDRVMEDDFGLRRFLPGSESPAETIFCTTRREFLEPIRAYLGVSSAVSQHWLETPEGEAGDRAESSPLARVAVHIPKQGCYVNGCELARRHELSNPSVVLDDEAAFREAARAIGEEKWGYGFITGYTAYGREKLERGLGRWDLAARLGVEIEGDGARALQAEELRKVSCLTEEGWPLWVGEYLAWRTDTSGEGLPVRTGFRLAQLVDGIEHLIGIVPWELVSGLLEAVRWIFLQTEIGPTLIHKSTRRLQKLYVRDDPRACQLRTHIAQTLVGKLEARLGVLPLPYAMIMAGNLTYDLRHSRPEQIAERARRYPRQNLDSRVAMLSFLDPMVKYDVSTMVSAAWHEFELEPPSALQWA